MRGRGGQNVNVLALYCCPSSPPFTVYAHSRFEVFRQGFAGHTGILVPLPHTNTLVSLSATEEGGSGA